MLDEPAQGKEKTERTEPAHPPMANKKYYNRIIERGRLLREFTD